MLFRSRSDNLLVSLGTPGVKTPTVGAPGRGLLRVDEQLPVELQMGSLQQPLQPGTLLRFGSLEFMSLDGSYDMVEQMLFSLGDKLGGKKPRQKLDGDRVFDRREQLLIEPA